MVVINTLPNKVYVHPTPIELDKGPTIALAVPLIKYPNIRTHLTCVKELKMKRERKKRGAGTLKIIYTMCILPKYTLYQV